MPSLRVVIVPGNGGSESSHTRDSNWYGWAADTLEASGLFAEVLFSDFPSSLCNFPSPSDIECLCDFVLSNEIVAKVFAMVAEARECRNILFELLGPTGCEIEVR
jgi:hypothetical protein